MKQQFIKLIDAYLQAGNITNWKRKDIDYFASMYTQIYNYANSLFNQFKAVKVLIIGEYLIFRYYQQKSGVYGTAKIKLETMIETILLPAIKEITTKHGQSIITANQYQLAA